MNIPTKKLKSGFEMPVFGIGTWRMGGVRTRDPQNDKKEISAIKTAIELGIAHIDTAELYAAGHAEELVARSIKGHDRSRLFIASKVLPQNLRYDDVISSCRASLARVGTDYFDLYFIHWVNPDIPLYETMRAFDHLMDEGLIKNIAVSNFATPRLKQAQSYTKHKIQAVQAHYNLQYREPEREGLLKFCQENDVMFIAWRSVQYGTFTKQGIPILDEICRKYDKTPAQIAINWLISQKNVITLSKMSSRDHIEENLGAIGWQMDKQDIERLRRDFPDQKDISDSVPLG